MPSCWQNWVDMTDIRTVLTSAADSLQCVSPTARLDAELLLAKVLNVTRTFFYSHPEYQLTNVQQEAFRALIDKRLSGLPIAWLTGQREFWSLNLQVNEQTLIPRPESELLVEQALSMLDRHAPATVLDLGTGSGAIALALAFERPHWQVKAVDKNPVAVETARDNARMLGIKNIEVLCSSWFDAIPTQQFHAIVSNPPYIAENDPHLQQGDVRFESRDALVSGKDGLDDLRYIIQYAWDWLLPNGILLLEHGYDQGEAVGCLLKQRGYSQVQCLQDMQGNDRVSVAIRH